MTSMFPRVLTLRFPKWVVSGQLWTYYVIYSDMVFILTTTCNQSSCLERCDVQIDENDMFYQEMEVYCPFSTVVVIFFTHLFHQQLDINTLLLEGLKKRRQSFQAIPHLVHVSVHHSFALFFVDSFKGFNTSCFPTTKRVVMFSLLRVCIKNNLSAW